MQTPHRSPPAGRMTRSLLSVFICSAIASPLAYAAAPATTAPDSTTSPKGEDTLTVTAVADDFKAGGNTPVPAYLDGGVANGGRLGILGEQDAKNVPFNVISFTDKLIQDQQARSLADVLSNDASVQSGYGYGNFSEAFMIRGFSLNGDDISYGGMYGVLPRQVVATNFADRVELFKGSNAFINGVSPSGSGVGGAINVEPKHAPSTPLTRVTMDYTSSSQIGTGIDVGRRFGDNDQWGVRVNALHREGDAAVDDEYRRTTLGSIGLDYRGDRFRSSLDLGYQKQVVGNGRPPVYVSPTLTKIPDAPSATLNYAQPWSNTHTENEFGMLKGEYDLTDHWTAYAGLGASHAHETGDYASPTITDVNGNGTVGRLSVPYFADRISTMAGLRGDFDTGFVSHKVNVGFSSVYVKTRTSYTMPKTADRGPFSLYDPQPINYPPTSFTGGHMDDPKVRNRSRSSGIAVSDTLGVLDDKVLLTLGARRQEVLTRGYTYDGVQSAAFDDTKVTPAYGLLVKPWEHVSLYANHIEALQPSDPAPSTAVNTGEVFPAITSKQNEVGAKFDFGTLGGSLALFEIKKPAAYTNSVTREYGLYGMQRNRGVELSVFGEPMYGVRLLGSAMWLKPELTDTNGGLNDGNDAIGVPNYQVVLGGEWDVPRVQNVTLTGKVIRTGSQYLNEANTQKLDAWTRLDLGVRYAMPMQEHTLTWRANLENVTNENYWASATGGYLTQGTPRQFKLSATYDF